MNFKIGYITCIGYIRCNEIWSPSGVVKWNIAYDTLPNVEQNIMVYNVDLFDVTKRFIDKVHNQSKKVICYFSAGTYENWRPDADNFSTSLLGNGLNYWPGERWLDIRSVEVVEIMKKRIEYAASKRCDAVDPDNVDGYQNPTGFELTYDDQLKFNKNIFEIAHEYKMATSLKNDLEQVKDLVNYVDFAVNESCLQYNECNLLLPFLEANKSVFHIEYSGNIKTICKKRPKNFSTLKKEVSLSKKYLSC